MKSSSGIKAPQWGLLTSHGQVLAFVAADPGARVRDIAQAVGITERRAAQILNDLGQAGYLTKSRIGRRNRYEIDGKRKVATPRLATVTVAELLALLLQALEQPFV